jgi:hypothetical protein
MKTRFAKLPDAQRLADLHVKCARTTGGGFGTQFGTAYMRAYYRILLSERWSVVLCTEDATGRVIGLASGTLGHFLEHERSLARDRVSLLCAALPALLRAPTLLRAVGAAARGRASQSTQGEIDAPSTAHFLFWAWDPQSDVTGGAILLMQKWMSIVRLLGAKRIVFRVDAANERLVRIHQLLGATTVATVETPDRGLRYVMEYSESHGRGASNGFVR